MANKITVTSAGTVVNANVTHDTAMYYSNKSREWAISDRIVDNTDYSSKYYANESKKQADISTAKAAEVVESGNNAVSNIESARDNAIVDITNQENVSVNNVNTAGATQIANVNSAGTTQINLAKEQVTLATNQANIAKEQATIATNKTSEVVASGNTALSNIDTAKNSAITSITNQETTSKASLIDEGATQIGLIQNEGATQIANVNSAGTTQINLAKEQVTLATNQANIAKEQATIATNKTSEVVASGNTALSNIDTAKNSAITSITNQETTSKASLIDEGATQIGLIQNEGATQIANVNSAGTTQINLAKEQVTLATNQANIAKEQATIATNKTSEVVASGNTALSNIDTAKNSAITSITNQETTSKASLIDEGATQIGLIQNEGATQIANVQSTGFYMRDDKLYFINSQGEETEFKSGGGLEVCDIGMALYIDETKGLRRRLNGTILDINTNTQAFLNRLLQIQTTNPEYFTTEDNWQAEALLNIDGCVYKFVLNYASDGETVVSVRLPKYPDYVEINAGGTLPVVGNGLCLGLTNGTSNVGLGGRNLSAFGQALSAYPSYYGASVGGSPAGDAYDYFNAFGVTTDPSKSGIEATLNQTKLKLRYFIQIAMGQETEVNITNEIELNNPYTLFDSKYSPDPLYNASWLKSDGEYKPKTTYVTAYEALVVENNSAVEAGTSVQLPSGSTYVKRGLSVKLSTAEDITDYDFVINTTNETFRLPLKNGMEGMFAGQAVIGNGITLGLTDGTNNGSLIRFSNSGASCWGVDCLQDGYGKKIGYNGYSGSSLRDNYYLGLTTDPAKSGLITSNTVPDGFALYYYVGETVQNANLIDAGRFGELVSTKANIDLSNCTRPYVIETYVNGTSWYRVWSDGWCEQGARQTLSDDYTLALLKPYKDTNYHVQGEDMAIDAVCNMGVTSRTNSTVTGNLSGTSSHPMEWKAWGYILLED